MIMVGFLPPPTSENGSNTKKRFFNGFQNKIKITAIDEKLGHPCCAR